MRLIHLSATFFLAIACASNIPAFAGGGSTVIGGGGDVTSQEFYSTLRAVIERLNVLAKDGDFSFANEEEAQALWDMLYTPNSKHLDVISEDHLYLRLDASLGPNRGYKVSPEDYANGMKDEILRKVLREVDAINIPSDLLIYVSRTRWINLLNRSRFSIALHELLGLIGKNDLGYVISDEFGDFMESHNVLARRVPKYRYGFKIDETDIQGTLDSRGYGNIELPFPFKLDYAFYSRAYLNPFPEIERCFYPNDGVHTDRELKDPRIHYNRFCFESVYDLVAKGVTNVRLGNWNGRYRGESNWDSHDDIDFVKTVKAYCISRQR